MMECVDVYFAKNIAISQANLLQVFAHLSWKMDNASGAFAIWADK